MSEGIFGAVVWVAKKFAINDELHYRADHNVEDNYHRGGNPIDV